MPLSQNVMFRRDLPTERDDEGDPGGLPIAEQLRAALKQRGWTVAEPDNWRDSGWSLLCTRGPAELEIALAGYDVGTWMLQVAPNEAPGFLGRALGRKVSAGVEDVSSLAKAVHEILAADDRYSSLRWQWDGEPTEDSPSEPHEPRGEE